MEKQRLHIYKKGNSIIFEAEGEEPVIFRCADGVSVDDAYKLLAKAFVEVQQ